MNSLDVCLVKRETWTMWCMCNAIDREWSSEKKRYSKLLCTANDRVT